MVERRCYQCNKLLYKDMMGTVTIEHGVQASRNSSNMGIEIKCPRCRFINTIFYIPTESGTLVENMID